MILILVNLFNNKKDEVTELEIIKIQELTETLINYSKAFKEEAPYIEKEISTAVEYYVSNNQKEVKISDIEKYVNERFINKISSEDIMNVGITSYLIEKNIIYDYDTNIYTDMNMPTQRDIANTPISYYVINDVTKNKNKYVVKYDEYIIKNLYDILNYTRDTENFISDVNINDYLTGNNKKALLFKILDEDMIKKISNKEGSLEVTFILEDNKLLIEDIK